MKVLDLQGEITRLRDMLNREQTRATALREKGKRLQFDYEAARERESRAKALLDELLERQRELTCVLDRANTALRRNEEILAQATPQMREMLQSLPEPDRESWIERLTGIQEFLTESEPAAEPDFALVPPVIGCMDYSFRLILSPSEPCSANTEFDLAESVAEDIYTLDVLKPSLVLGLDSRFALTLPNGECERRALDDKFQLEAPAPNGCVPTFSLPFPNFPGQPDWETHPALDFDAIIDISADLPETKPDPIPSIRACPRCGRESDVSHAACPYCYAPMEKQVSERPRGIFGGLMRLGSRR